MSNPLQRLESIDRRILYAVLLIIVVVGLLVPIPLPLAVGPQARGVYEAIENADPGKIVIVSTLWSASTQGENSPQTRVILQHLMRKRLRFALIAFGDPQSTTLAQELAEELARENSYEYGKDWINWGFRADIAGTLKGLVKDINETIKTDSIKKRPLSEYPVMQGIHNVKDVGVIAEVSASGNYVSWLGLVVGSTNAPFCYAPTSVMAPELYTYLDSGQMKGMLFGIKGAAEYERLLGIRGFTTRAITPVSLSLVLLFVLIGLGNYGMYAAKKRDQKGANG
ncbi:MAG: hypothetical protein GX446_01560 [Chthonomonadales bacterium]|nr:hypothetical protein [Chthonomonadales bacterium]